MGGAKWWVQSAERRCLLHVLFFSFLESSQVKSTKQVNGLASRAVRSFSFLVHSLTNGSTRVRL